MHKLLRPAPAQPMNFITSAFKRAVSWTMLFFPTALGILAFPNALSDHAMSVRVGLDSCMVGPSSSRSHKENFLSLLTAALLPFQLSMGRVLLRPYSPRRDYFASLGNFWRPAWHGQAVFPLSETIRRFPRSMICSPVWGLRERRPSKTSAAFGEMALEELCPSTWNSFKALGSAESRTFFVESMSLTTSSHDWEYIGLPALFSK